MRYLALALVAVGIPALPAQSLSADFSGHWRYFERDAIEITPRTYDHSADFVLWQRAPPVADTIATLNSSALGLAELADGDGEPLAGKGIDVQETKAAPAEPLSMSY